MNAKIDQRPSSPNPGPLHTTLRFTLPAAGRAILRVYDLGGRRVRTLVEASLEAGPHAVEWNGRDDSGSRVASGPYFVELAFGGRAAAEKVTIVR